MARNEGRRPGSVEDINLVGMRRRKKTYRQSMKCKIPRTVIA